MIQTQLEDLSAFCPLCPDANEVTHLLAGLGLSLIFSIPSKHYVNYPAMPAQYHYGDTHGTEVIFLAGRDTPESNAVHYPSHASRWWLYAGSSQDNYHLVAQLLRAAWGMEWHVFKSNNNS